MSDFKPIGRDSLVSKTKDPEDLRIGDLVVIDSELVPKNGWVLAGYPDDEGVRLNGGRAGAALAPASIRKYLYRSTPSSQRLNSLTLVDRGNLDPESMSLAERHGSARKEAARCMGAGARWLSFGGGHDYGFPDVAGFLDVFGSDNPLVINFDAHLDVRPTSKGFHSGTPFRRMLDEFKDVEFVEIGIQDQCNSRTHLSWLQSHGGEVLFLDDLVLSGQKPGTLICERLLPKMEKMRPVFISIDLDVFASAFAPGCSQSWPYGLDPSDVMVALEFIGARSQVKGTGLYEVSPPLDVDDRTSRLAAQLAHRILFLSGPRS